LLLVVVWAAGCDTDRAPKVTDVSSGADPAGPATPLHAAPDAATTGVPAGTVLTPSGSVEVEQAGTVLSGLDVRGTIRIAADDVTIRDTRVTSSDYWPIWVDPGAHGLTVVDTEVVGSGSCQAGIGTHDYRAIRIDVHGCGDGAKASQNTVIESSWFHDYLMAPGSHNDGIQVSDGAHIVIEGNRIDASPGQTSAIMVGPDFGSPISDVTIEGNWLDGGAYTLYLNADRAVVRGNRFGRGATVGPVDVKVPPAEWRGNVWADTGSPVTP
jgi:hypothetical protein